MRFAHTGALFSIVLATFVFAADPDPIQPTPAAVTPEQIAVIKLNLAKLNSPDTVMREEAERELLRVGIPALELLKEAAKVKEIETAARARRVISKITLFNATPVTSYAEVMPANSIFFLEFSDSRQFLDKLKLSPLGRFWDLPQTQKYYKVHAMAQVPTDQKILDAIRAMPKMLDGKALFAHSDPTTADPAELDPGFVYVLETKQSPALEEQARNLYTGLADPPKSARPYGPFHIDEHISAQTVFGQQSIIHSLTQKGVESFLDGLLRRPEKTLQSELTATRQLLPNYDYLFHLSADGIKQLSEASQMVDEEQVRTLEMLGFTPGSVLRGVGTVTPNGFEEKLTLKLGGDDKNQGLFAVLNRMNVAVAGGPSSMDLVPWQTAMLLSFNGDVAANFTALGTSLRALDALKAGAMDGGRGDAEKKVAPPKDDKKPGAAIVPPAPPGVVQPGKPGKTLGQKALNAGGADLKAPTPKDEPKDAKKDVKAVADPAKPLAGEYVTRLEKLGLKLERFLEHVHGPVQLALFMEHIEDEEPDTLPIIPLICVALKEAKTIEQILEANCVGLKPRFTKEVLNGGTHYVESEDDEETKPGFWLKDNYLCWSTERDVLDFAGAALANKQGNERFTARDNYKAAVALKNLDPKAFFTMFGDAEQVMEMPYKLSALLWAENEGNPWPDYAFVKPLLKNKTVLVQVKSTPEGMQATAITPFSLLGLIEILRRPLIEAGFW